jgi:DNA-binding transcriptional LysR family regulator
MDNRLDLNAVATFVRIVEAGSLSAAARALGMPKTTVSKRLAMLEASLGVTLITRTTRKLRCTEAGKAYYERSQVAIRQLEEARAATTSQREHPSGRFRITAPVDISHGILPRIVASFLLRYPSVKVELIVTNRLIDLLGEEVDLAIRAGRMRDSGLVGRRFIGLSSNIYGSAEYLLRFKAPLSPADLDGVDFIGFAGMKRIDLVNGRSTFRISAKPRVQVDDLETLKALISQSVGIGWLPDFLAQTSELKLLPALPNWRAKSAGQVHFLYPNSKHPSASVVAFVNLAISMLPTILPGSGSA